MNFFEKAGVPLKTERGNRVFPVSDHSSDIIRALERELKKAGAQIHLHTEVREVCTENEKAAGVLLADGTFFEADAVVVATGGLSYPSTGSTGDGYRFAAATGHKVVAQSPSLVPLVAKEDYVSKPQGLSLRNVELTVKSGKKVLYKDFGEMMFTHFGVTGPLILSASAKIGKKLEKGPLPAFLDLKPALDAEQLDARILREFDANHNKQFKNVIGVLFPSSLTPVMIELGGIPGEKPVHEISREERLAFGRLIKAFPFTITGMGEFKEAIITRGGVSVKEIQPSTMESKKVKNLYFAGEVLDLDAVTGGYNLQIAWSTAYLAATDVCGAGKRITERKEKTKFMGINIAIDGPAGAGKSTIAKKVAKELSFIYVDTGAIYRAMALERRENGISGNEKISEAWHDADISIRYENGERQVIFNGKNVTAFLRREEVGNMASVSSANPEVRKHLLKLQRNLAQENDVVMDGRDIGTTILPDAEVKIFLTASARTRANRRYLELTEKGEPCSMEEILKDIIDRDERDMNRAVSPLRQAEDAVLVDSSEMGIDEVVKVILSVYREKVTR